jgi:short subunit dehydrogenase-like uncharacterized protein
MTQWMIYGANGYTGRLIAQAAASRGMQPVLAGRSDAAVSGLAKELGLEHRVFSLDHAEASVSGIAGMGIVLHCAGPFSATARPMMEACIKAGSHYLDITGEIAVFELAHELGPAAASGGVLLCPGTGFDVVPTDCLAAKLASALPDATKLALGFDSRSGFSPGTAKTSVEGLAGGGKVRRHGELQTVPLAWRTRRIDFGDGEKLAMTIPWGDVSTAYRTTGIPDIDVYIPASPNLVKRLKRMNAIRPLLGLGLVQKFMKAQVDKRVHGPSETQRAELTTAVWGEVVNAAGKTVTGRIRTANGYDVTVSASLEIVAALLAGKTASGHVTPARLMGTDFVTQLPGSGAFELG